MVNVPATYKDSVKAGVAGPLVIYQICFTGTTQTCRLHWGDCVPCTRYGGAIFYFDKNDCVATAGNDIQFGPVGIAASDIAIV